MRTFLSITPDAGTAIKIAQWCSLCWPTNRLVAVQNYHVTLAFLGDVNRTRLEMLQQMLDGVRLSSFEISLDDLGYWPDSTTLWLGSTSVPEQLTQLATVCRRMANRAGIKVDKSRYLPHLTLARKTFSPPGPPLTDPNFYVLFDSFQLYQSILDNEGVRYVELNTWALGRN